jgi:hypothetical protein
MIRVRFAQDDDAPRRMEGVRDLASAICGLEVCDSEDDEDDVTCLDVLHEAARSTCRASNACASSGICSMPTHKERGCAESMAKQHGCAQLAW